MDQFDLALLDEAEGRQILWKLALRTPVGMGTVCAHWALLPACGRTGRGERRHLSDCSGGSCGEPRPG